MEKRKTFGLSWFRKYPVKALIFIFIIIIPLIFITTYTTTSIIKSNRFYFETEENGDPIYLNKKDLTSNKKLEEYLDLDIKLKSIVTPKEKTISDEIIYEGGRYIFDIKYTKKENINSTFNFTWMLDTKWEENRSTPQNLNITENNSERSITYNYALPFRKYGLIKVNRPNLYLKIVKTDDDILDGLPGKVETIYMKIDLSNFKPDVTTAR